ncbi:MAG TPA: hypothetical protein ENF77_02295, partial [Candidatus Acetothermia bacterium]|nr:hypothetical protein [Candidatus Acetothermia bacterium]
RLEALLGASGSGSLPEGLLELYGVPRGSGGELVPAKEAAKLVPTATTVSHLHSLLPAIKLNHPVLLVGETASGKSALVRYLAYLTHNPYVRINLKDMAEVSELVGSYHPTETGELVWKDGLLVEAMRKGWWVVLDEANLAGPGVLERLNQLLDRGGYLHLQEREGEDIKPHPNFRLFVTMNPTDYAGRNPMSPAFLNRFLIKWIEPLPEEELAEILVKEFGLPEDLARRAAQFHLRIRQLAERRHLGRTRAERFVYTIRDLQEVAAYLRKGPGEQEEMGRHLVRYIRDVHGGRLVSEEDRKIFEDLLKACFPKEWLEERDEGGI